MSDASSSDDELPTLLSPNAINVAEEPIAETRLDLSVYELFANDRLRIGVYSSPGPNARRWAARVLTTRGLHSIFFADVAVRDTTLRGRDLTHERCFYVGSLPTSDAPTIICFDEPDILICGYLRRYGFLLVHVDEPDDVWGASLPHTTEGNEMHASRSRGHAPDFEAAFDFKVRAFTDLNVYLTMPYPVTCVGEKGSLDDFKLPIEPADLVDFLNTVEAVLGWRAYAFRPSLEHCTYLTKEDLPEGTFNFEGRSFEYLYGPSAGESICGIDDALIHLEYSDFCKHAPQVHRRWRFPRFSRWQSWFCFLRPKLRPEEHALWINIPTGVVRTLTYSLSRILNLHGKDPHEFRKHVLSQHGGIPVDHSEIDGYMKVDGRLLPVMISGHLANLLVISHFSPMDIFGYVDYIEWNFHMTSGAKFSQYITSFLDLQLLGERNNRRDIRELWHNLPEWYLATFAARTILKYVGEDEYPHNRDVGKMLNARLARHKLAYKPTPSSQRNLRSEPVVQPLDPTLVKRAPNHRSGSPMV
jgi:hypothetical protein